MSTEPKHTQAELHLTSDGDANFYGIAVKGRWLMRIQQNGELSTEEQVANVERMVKLWNAHDELMEGLKQIAECQNTVTYYSDRTLIDNVVRVAKRLIQKFQQNKTNDKNN